MKINFRMLTTLKWYTIVTKHRFIRLTPVSYPAKAAISIATNSYCAMNSIPPAEDLPRDHQRPMTLSPAQCPILQLDLSIDTLHFQSVHVPRTTNKLDSRHHTRSINFSFVTWVSDRRTMPRVLCVCVWRGMLPTTTFNYASRISSHESKWASSTLT